MRECAIHIGAHIVYRCLPTCLGLTLWGPHYLYGVHTIHVGRLITWGSHGLWRLHCLYGAHIICEGHPVCMRLSTVTPPVLGFTLFLSIALSIWGLHCWHETHSTCGGLYQLWTLYHLHGFCWLWGDTVCGLSSCCQIHITSLFNGRLCPKLWS